MTLKRVFDIVASSVLIVLTLPIMVLVALLVKIDSYGGALFFQTRVRENRRHKAKKFAYDRRSSDLGGRPFTMYKFRSMVQEAEQLLPSMVNLSGLGEPVFKLGSDPRVTRFGRLLRQSSLDELPQLFNVLKGDMSLVGPRPEAMNVVRLYGAKHKKRLQIKPGITGLQQITCRGTECMKARLKYDTYYIKHHSMLLDLTILLKTFLVVVNGNGAR